VAELLWRNYSRSKRLGSKWRADRFSGSYARIGLPGAGRSLAKLHIVHNAALRVVPQLLWPKALATEVAAGEKNGGMHACPALNFPQRRRFAHSLIGISDWFVI
jgi:hypothetical protein